MSNSRKKSTRVHRMDNIPQEAFRQGIQKRNSEDEIGPIFQMRNSDAQLIQRRYSKGMKMRKSTLDFRGVLADFRCAAHPRDENEEVEARL